MNKIVDTEILAENLWEKLQKDLTQDQRDWIIRELAWQNEGLKIQDDLAQLQS